MYVHRKSLNINLEANWGFPVKPGRNANPGGWELGRLLLLWLRGSKDFPEIITSKEKGPGQYLSNIKVGFCVFFAISHIALVLFPSNLDKTFHRVQRWAAWLRSQVLPPAMAASFPLTEDFLVPGPRLFTITSGVISSDLINFPSIRNASKTTWTPHALHPWTLLDHLAPACSWSAKKKLHIWPQIAPARNSPPRKPAWWKKSICWFDDGGSLFWQLVVKYSKPVQCISTWFVERTQLHACHCTSVQKHLLWLWRLSSSPLGSLTITWQSDLLKSGSPTPGGPDHWSVTKWQQLLNFLDSLLLDSGICLHMQPVHGLVCQPNQCV